MNRIFKKSEVEIIKISDTLTIVVDKTAKIKENTNTFKEGLNGDWYWNSIHNNEISRAGDITRHDIKIIATIGDKLEGVPAIEIENEDERELKKLANNYKGFLIETGTRLDCSIIGTNGYIIGYKTAQEKGCYTEEDLRKTVLEIWEWCNEESPSLLTDQTLEEKINSIIQSLKQSKEISEIELEYKERYSVVTDYHPIVLVTQLNNTIKPINIKYK